MCQPHSLKTPGPHGRWTRPPGRRCQARATSVRSRTLCPQGSQLNVGADASRKVCSHRAPRGLARATSPAADAETGLGATLFTAGSRGCSLWKRGLLPKVAAAPLCLQPQAAGWGPGAPAALLRAPALPAPAALARRRWPHGDRRGGTPPDLSGAYSSGSRASSKSPGVSRVSDDKGTAGPQVARERSQVYKWSHQPGVPDRYSRLRATVKRATLGPAGAQCPSTGGESTRPRALWRVTGGPRTHAGPVLPGGRRQSHGPTSRHLQSDRDGPTAQGTGWHEASSDSPPGVGGGDSPQATPSQNPGVGGSQATGSVQPLPLLPELGPRTEWAPRGPGGVAPGEGEPGQPRTPAAPTLDPAPP